NHSEESQSLVNLARRAFEEAEMVVIHISAKAKDGTVRNFEQSLREVDPTHSGGPKFKHFRATILE
ncbi:MAG: hypothetical protein ACT4P5_16140, partial [Armatimonadota bacterium]